MDLLQAYTQAILNIPAGLADITRLNFKRTYHHYPPVPAPGGAPAMLLLQALCQLPSAWPVQRHRARFQTCCSTEPIRDTPSNLMPYFYLALILLETNTKCIVDRLVLHFSDSCLGLLTTTKFEIRNLLIDCSTCDAEEENRDPS